MMGDSIPLRLPRELAKAFGYPGTARYVGFSFSDSDDVIWSDGVGSGNGHTWTYLSFKRHPAVAPHLMGYRLGSSEEPAAHVLLIDTETDTARIAPAAQARAFLVDQHGPVPDMTPEELAAVREEFSKLLAEYRARPLAHEEMHRQMRERATRLAAMLAFLDQQVPPGQGQTPC